MDKEFSEQDPTCESFCLKFTYSCQTGTPIVKGVNVKAYILVRTTFTSATMVNDRVITGMTNEAVMFMKKV